MRITNSMLSSNFLYDLNNNLQNMQSLQQQMATNKKINRASDDPLAAAKIIELNTQISQNDQYNTNISETADWLNVTDTTLGQVGNVFQRLNELLISGGGNAAYSPDEKQSIKDEINQNIEQLSQVLNTNYDGKYIFGGTRGTDKPVGTTTDALGNKQLAYMDKDGVTTMTATSLVPPDAQTTQINQIKSKLTVETSQGVTMDYSVSAGDITEFKNDSGVSKDLRDILKSIVNHLDGKNADGTAVTAANPDPTTEISTTDLANIKDCIANVSKLRTQVGAQENRMATAKAQNTDQNTNLTDVLSKTEDVDMAEATMQYSVAQTVYLASLQTSAKVIQPTLMDYLR